MCFSLVKCVYVCVYTVVCLCTLACVYVFMCMYLFMYVYVFMCLSVCKFYMFARVCVYIYIYMYECYIGACMFIQVEGFLETTKPLRGFMPKTVCIAQSKYAGQNHFLKKKTHEAWSQFSLSIEINGSHI